MQLHYNKSLVSGQNTLTLDPVESRHIIKVLRHKEGDLMLITNGKGLSVKGQITIANPKRCELKILEEQLHPKLNNYVLHLGIAPTKNIDRFEWFLEKATEIGIDRITPLLCEHSERKIIKHERLEKIMIAALKQSGQYHLPQLDPLISFNDFTAEHFDGQQLIAHCLPDNKKSLKSILTKGENVQILIGPEGDFSQHEIDLALTKHYIPVTLGHTRLRTETAGVVATHTVALNNTD
ncbi:MAG: 16S rRNA (uracil(1498)-N(3))-methyltransferase [Flavobacteriia bacterium]|nr:MAG: 16S rRNA (uracil(1498)-N(3))-methyltransferase [Flavobacteriia bacterium]